MILTVVDPGVHDLFLGNLGYLTLTTIESNVVIKLWISHAASLNSAKPSRFLVPSRILLRPSFGMRHGWYVPPKTIAQMLSWILANFLSLGENAPASKFGI